MCSVTFIKLHALLRRGKCTTFHIWLRRRYLGGKSLLILHQCERLPWQHVHPMSICYLSHTILMPLSMPTCMCMHVHTQQCAGAPHIWWINAPTCTQVFARCAWWCQWLLKSRCKLKSMMSQAFVILFMSISIQGHCFQDVKSSILCQSAVIHAVSLLWSDKMIGRGWEEGIIQRVAPAGCNRRPPELTDIQRSHRSWPSSLLSNYITVTCHNAADKKKLTGRLHVWTRK